MKLTCAGIARTPSAGGFPCQVTLDFNGDRTVTVNDVTFEHALSAAIFQASCLFQEELREQITLRQDYAIIIDL